MNRLPPEPLTIELVSQLLPPLVFDRNKYSAGEVLLVGGVAGMEGAAFLSGEAALRSGAGIVKWLQDPGSNPSGCPAEMVRIQAVSHREDALRELERAKSILVGVGCSPLAPPSWIVEMIQIAQERQIPVVWDGGSLHWIRKGWAGPRAGDCLTPHAGELTVLEPLSAHDLQQAAHNLVERWGVTIIAKGPITWIASPSKAALSSHDGDPGMATAGVGDVLAGLVAGLIAQGLPSRDAAICAVWLHSHAGRSAAICETSYCMTASSVIAHLPDAFKELLKVKNSSTHLNEY
jgi:hydroxyethylthiazole kinase-like uncharacterized protein yjeF